MIILTINFKFPIILFNIPTKDFFYKQQSYPNYNDFIIIFCLFHLNCISSETIISFIDFEEYIDNQQQLRKKLTAFYIQFNCDKRQIYN